MMRWRVFGFIGSGGYDTVRRDTIRVARRAGQRQTRVFGTHTIHAYSALDSYVYGFALQEQALPFDNPENVGEAAEEMLSQFPAEEYPYLKETIVELINKSGWEYADEFEFGLNLILDGLEKLRAMA
jgi:hypothetical protein